MGIIASAAGAGLGQGLAGLGNFMMASEERERLQQEKYSSLAAIRAQGAGGGGKGMDPLEKRLGEVDPSNYGFNVTPTDKAAFQTVPQAQAVQDPVSTDGGQYPDALSRKGAIIANTMGLDTSGYNAAEDARAKKNTDLRVQTLSPAAYESYQKGMQEAVVTRLTSAMEKIKDPAAREALRGEIADVTNATTTGERFDVKGDQKFNRGSGTSVQTDEGNAKAYKDRKEGDAAGTREKSEGAGLIKAEQVLAVNNLNKAQALTVSLMGMTKDISSKDKPAHQERIKAAEASAAKYQAEADALAARLTEYNKTGGKFGAAIKVVKDNAPAAVPKPAPPKILNFDPKTGKIS